MHIEKSGSLLSSLLTDAAPESRQAAQSAIVQSVSQMSCFWGDFKKVKAKVMENTQSIKDLVTNQNNVKTKQQDIIGRLEKLEKYRNEDAYANLVKKIEKVEGQMKILSKSRQKNDVDLLKRKRDSVSNPSIEELIRDNKLQKASVAAMKNYLRKKKRQRVQIDGKPIVITGSKSALIARINKLLEKPEEKESVSPAHEKRSSEIEKRKELREARKLRFMVRQKRKDRSRRIEK